MANNSDELYSIVSELESRGFWEKWFHKPVNSDLSYQTFKTALSSRKEWDKFFNPPNFASVLDPESISRDKTEHENITLLNFRLRTFFSTNLAHTYLEQTKPNEALPNFKIIQVEQILEGTNFTALHGEYITLEEDQQILMNRMKKVH
jgi:hypothetical protein